MYLVVKTDSIVDEEGNVTVGSGSIEHIQLSADIPSYVTESNAYVYADLADVEDPEAFIDEVICNIDTATIGKSPKGCTVISCGSINMGTVPPKTSRLIDNTDWNSSIPMSWVRMLTTVHAYHL